MAISINVKVVSTFRKHGSAGAKPTKVHSTAASKFNAVLNKLAAKQNLKDTAENSTTSGNEEAQANGSSAINEEAEIRKSKPYGKHNGNIHVKLLNSFSNQKDWTSAMNYVANVTSALEARHSFDLKAAKNAYRTFKDEVVKSFAEKFGTNLSEEATTKMLNTLAQKAFTYTSHQIIIEIISDEQIEGGHQRETDNKWILILKSKMYYTEKRTLLSESDILGLSNIGTDKVAERVTSVTRIPAILLWDTKEQKYRVSFRSAGSLTVFDSY